MVRFVQDDRKSIAAQITTVYKYAIQKGISECSMHQHLMRTFSSLLVNTHFELILLC